MVRGPMVKIPDVGADASASSTSARSLPRLALVPTRAGADRPVASPADLLGDLNRWLDRLPRAEIRLGDRVMGTWRVATTVGFVVAFALELLVVTLLGEPIIPVVAGMAVGLSLYFMMMLVRWKLTGRTRHVLYEGLAVGLVAALGTQAWVGTTNLLRALDVQVVGLAAMLVFGRIGCFLRGCCWGVRSDFGVRYPLECHKGRSHGRRFPVQIIESTSWMVLTVVAGALCLTAAPGVALGVVLTVYALVRATLEQVRGDPRPHTFGLSSSSWWSVAGLLGGLVLLDHAELDLRLVVTLLVTIGLLVLLSIGIRRWVAPDELPLEEMVLIGQSVRLDALTTTPATWRVAGLQLWARREQDQVSFGVRGTDEPISSAKAQLYLEHLTRGLGLTLDDPPLCTAPNGEHTLSLYLGARPPPLTQEKSPDV